LTELRVAVLPRDPNPYQESLYEPMRAAGAEVRYAGSLTGSHTANLLLLPAELLWLRLRGFQILHLHWTFGFRPSPFPKSRAVGRLSRAWFVFNLRLVTVLGFKLVWTAHNALPHSPVFDDDVKARQSLLRHADLVIVHSAQALDELARFGVAPRRTAIIRHGPLGPTELRLLPPPYPGGRRTVTFFGRVAAYKGVDELVQAMAQVNTDLRLVIAGSCPNPAMRAALQAAAAADPRIELRLEHIPDDELVALLEQADALAFPFRAITTSGSLVLGLSAARAAIVPDLPALGDIPRAALIPYEPGIAGIVRALTQVATMPSMELRRKGRAARDAVAGPSWAELAEQTGAEFEAVLEEPSWLSALRNNYLLTGSATLLINTLLLAVFGFVFWALAARTYSSSSVGVYSGVNSLSTLLGTVAGLGCPLAIIRFLPNEPHQRRLAVVMIVTVLVLGTLVVALVELVAGPFLFPRVHIPQDLKTGVLTLLLVVVASVGAVTDAALITDRATMTVLLKNIVGSVAKIVILFPLARLGTTGLITAATLGGVVAAVLGAAALWRRLPPSTGPWHEAERAVEYVRYSLTGYAAVLIGILPITVVPLLVLGEQGQAAAGWFSMAFLISSLLSFVPSTAAQVLFAEGSRAPDALRANTITALKAIYGLLFPSVLVLAVVAPWLLGLLGHPYAVHAGNALRAMAVGSLFLGATYIIDSILTAMDRMRGYFVINVINSALVVGLVAVFARSGLTAIALTWDVAQGLSVFFGLAVLFGPRLMQQGRVKPQPVTGPGARG
jgi:O-antigen/teichoic acid export membrane protein/glycosyltransferase involved in cell wall biosynthesis